MENFNNTGVTHDWIKGIMQVPDLQPNQLDKIAILSYQTQVTLNKFPEYSSFEELLKHKSYASYTLINSIVGRLADNPNTTVANFIITSMEYILKKLNNSES